MTSKKQIEANRENAARSTGPKSPEGKAASSKNAMKNGLLSRDLIIHGESREEFDDLLRQLDEEYRPHGPVEQFLVERIATTLWRMRRLVRVESAQLAVQLKKAAVVDLQLLKQIAPRVSEAELATLSFEEGLDTKKDHDFLKAVALELATLLPQAHPSGWESLEKATPKVFSLFVQFAKQIGRDSRQWFSELSKPEGAFHALMVRVMQLRGIQSALQDQRETLQAAQGLPPDPEKFVRYQSALDNELYKAIKTLRAQQDRRLATIEAVGDRSE